MRETLQLHGDLHEPTGWRVWGCAGYETIAHGKDAGKRNFMGCRNLRCQEQPRNLFEGCGVLYLEGKHIFYSGGGNMKRSLRLFALLVAAVAIFASILAPSTAAAAGISVDPTYGNFDTTYN